MDEHTDNPSQSLFVVDVRNTDRSKNGYSQVQAFPLAWLWPSALADSGG